MKVHPRTQVVREADREISGLLLEVEKKHELTAWEIVGILLGYCQSIKKYELRAERHPDDPDAPADIE